MLLTKVQADLMAAIISDSALSGDIGDDGMGGIPIIMAYVDDVNALIPLKYVRIFLDSFCKHVKGLGAVLNTKKTRL